MLGAVAIAVVIGGALAYVFIRERNREKRSIAATPVKRDQFMREQPSRENTTREQPAVNSLQLQLQAYERLILLTERIALPNVVSRLNRQGLSLKEMQLSLIQQIKQEFEYNITQQIYVSAEAWDAVRNLKDQNILIINQVASFLPAESSGPELNRQILEMIVQNPRATLHQVVEELLSFEARKLMSPQ